MSHTGFRAYRNRRAPLDNVKPTHITLEDLVVSKGGKLDSQQFTGEFQGNGITVLTGLSTSQTFDIDNVLNDNEKGVIIGYTNNSPYFQLFMNDGLGPKVVYTFPDKFKDEQYHSFGMGLTNVLNITLDGADLVFTTNTI
jgi:hypothetical protein